MSNSDDEKGEPLQEFAQRIIEDADGAEALQAFKAVRKSVHGAAKEAQGALDAIRPVLAQLREEAENHHSQLLGLGKSIMAHNLLREAGYLPHGVERLSLADAIDRTIYEHALALLRDKNSRGEQPDGEKPPSDAVERARSIAWKRLAKFIEDHLSTVEGRYWRVLRLIVNLERHSEPEGVFYKYVDGALEGAGAEDVSDERRDRLARELFKSVQRLVGRFIEGHGNQPDDAPDMWAVDGMLWLDAVAIDWLEAEVGAEWDGWRTDPDGARELARERWESDPDAGNLFTLWVDPNESMPWKLKPVAWVCRELVEYHEQFRDPEPPTITGIFHAGDRYGKLEKTAAAVTTRGALDEQSQRTVDIDDAGSVTVDNERYSNAPGVLRVIPQTMGVTPAHQSESPHEVQLPLSLNIDDEGAPLPLTIYADTQAILKPKAAKLAVALHLLASEDGALATVELGRLTEWTNQGRYRPGGKPKREAVRNDLFAVRSLGIPGDLMGDGLALSHNIQMFQIAVPESLSSDAEVVFGRTGMFQRLIRSLGAKGGPWSKLHGNILINADGFMRISGNDSDAARMYLALCAFWNDRRWNPDNIEWVHVDKLGHRANTLTLAARRYLQGKGGDRRRISEGRNDTEKTVDKLIDKYELAGEVDAKGRGSKRQLLIRPTDEHREAWQRLRTGRDQRLDI